jgi:alpha-glucosidase
MPWGSESDPVVAERLALYRHLIGLRRAHSVLASGGMRWLHVDEETVVFVRESASESMLVLATRGGADAELAPGALPGAAHAESAFGEATLAVASDGAVMLAADGPAFAAWTLPGVAVPAA